MNNLNLFIEKKNNTILSTLKVLLEKGIKLPLTYLLFQNCFEVTPKLNIYSEATGEKLFNEDNDFLGVLVEPNKVLLFEKFYDIMVTIKNHHEFILKYKLFPIADKTIPNGSLYISLDEKNYGKIYAIDWEYLEEEHDWLLISFSFDSFIDKLQVFPIESQKLIYSY